MFKQSWQSIAIISAFIGANCLNSTIATAQTRETQKIPTTYIKDVSTHPMSQITSVNELRDVDPTAWAYEALRSLVERYGCIVGYPDRTYRGNRALSRWEFAAGLNACLNTIERLIQDGVGVLREDIDKLKRLAQEFESELAVLGTRVDNLEQRVAFLEDHQFSTTTKLRAEIIFVVGGVSTEQRSVDSGRPRNRNQPDEQIFFSNRVRLNFQSSFTGKDTLRTRLQAGNTPNLGSATGTDMARLGFDGGSNNDVIIDDLFYRFPLGEKGTVWIGANGLDIDDIFVTANPFLESSGTGALNRYLRYDPLVYRGPQGTGIGFKYNLTDNLSFNALYLGGQDTANIPEAGKGIFNGDYSTGVQIDIGSANSFLATITYIHSYFAEGNTNLSGSTGSGIARNPFGSVASTRDSVGVHLSWRVLPFLNLGGWGAYAKAYTQGNDNEADLWNWSANISFVDLGKEGAALTLAGGQPPKAYNVKNGQEDEDTSYMLEAQYQFPVTNNILLTPGFYVIFNPNHNDRNATVWIGAIRTTFRF